MEIHQRICETFEYVLGMYVVVLKVKAAAAAAAAARLLLITIAQLRRVYDDTPM